jgi:LmbE family N-acetylglucosaminyl deacetylase
VPVRLLALFAHPRDASLLTGGTLARYAGAGCDVTAVSATRGEAAPVLRGRAAGDELGAVRTREFQAAGRILGVRDVVSLDYAHGALAGLEPELLEDLFTDLIRAIEPQVVVTFGRDGLDGDSDHRAVHAAASGAFFTARTLAGDGSSGPDKLYFALWPEPHAGRALRVLETGGVPTSAIPAVRGTIESATGVSTIIDVRASLGQKLEAIRAHASQLDPAFDGIDPALLADLWGQEFFARAFPHPWITGVIERDLLAGRAAGAPVERQAS